MALCCAFCGREVNGDTYIIQGGLTWCSEDHWNRWHDLEDECRWEGESQSHPSA